MERVGAAELGLPDGEISAAHMLALGLAEGESFAGGEGNGHRLCG